MISCHEWHFWKWKLHHLGQLQPFVRAGKGTCPKSGCGPNWISAYTLLSSYYHSDKHTMVIRTIYLLTWVYRYRNPTNQNHLLHAYNCRVRWGEMLQLSAEGSHNLKMPRECSSSSSMSPWVQWVLRIYAVQGKAQAFARCFFSGPWWQWCQQAL